MFDKQVSVRTSRELYKDKLSGIPKVFRTTKFLSSHYPVDRSLVGEVKISVEVCELFLFWSEVCLGQARGELEGGEEGGLPGGEARTNTGGQQVVIVISRALQRSSLISRMPLSKMYYTYWTRNRTLGVRNVLIVNFSCVLLQIEIATKSLLTNVTSVRLVIVVSVHVESKIVDLQCIS